MTSPAPPQGPSTFKLVGIVALIVALDILIFFGIGYLLGTLILG